MTTCNIKPDVNPQAIPGFMLWQVSKLWQRQLNTALKPFAIGNTEFVLLGNTVRFAQLGQSVTPVLLMDATKVDRMTASQTIRSLEKKHLIERVSLPQDKRTFHIMPTPEGTKLADKALGEVIKSHTAFFAPLQNDAGQFLAIMQKLIEGNSDERAA
jgi:DNA-binding MarR family transcriptional regulator